MSHIADAPPRPKKKPLTVVSPSVQISLQEMANRVVKTRQDHGELLQAYHETWYNAPHTWHYTFFLGVGVMKCPNDLWMYQQLIAEYRPRTIIETGTYKGGSALWFAFLMDLLTIDGGHIWTVDLEDYRECSHQRVTYLDGDSTDPALVAAIAEELPETGGRLVVLDADHGADHVYQELCLYAPLLRVGDWMVVEDTNIAWVGEGGDQGARGGLERYLREHEGEFVQDVLCERYLLTMNPGGWLMRIADGR